MQQRGPQLEEVPPPIAQEQYRSKLLGRDSPLLMIKSLFKMRGEADPQDDGHPQEPGNLYEAASCMVVPTGRLLDGKGFRIATCTCAFLKLILVRPPFVSLLFLLQVLLDRATELAPVRHPGRVDRWRGGGPPRRL